MKKMAVPKPSAQPCTARQSSLKCSFSYYFFLHWMSVLLSVDDAEGEHSEVVVLLGAVAELVGVGLEGLDDVAHT